MGCIAFVLFVFEFHGLYCFCAGVYCFRAGGGLNLVGYGYHKCEIGVYSENPFARETRVFNSCI